MFFFQRNWSSLLFLLFFIIIIIIGLFLALALSLCSTLMQTLTFSWKKDSALLLFFFSFKVRVTMQFTAEIRGVLERQIFTPAYMREGSAIKAY